MAVVGLIAAALYETRVVQPVEPVAIVNGDEILTREFRGRVRLIQYNLLQQYQSIQQIMDLVADNPQALATYQTQLDNVAQQLGNPTFVGTTMLQALIEERLIEHEAAERGIEVSEADIDAWLEESFGFTGDPTPIVATATLVPDATPGPTVTPYTRELYERALEAYLTNVGRYGVEEEALRADVRARLLRERLLETFEEEVPMEQEQVHARHILVNDEGTAQEVLDQLEAAEDWNELAVEYSIDASNREQGGDLGWFSRGRMVEPFEQAAFEAEVGEIVGPVQTDFGWHLIEVLGHEQRELEPSAYEQALARHLDEWLAEQSEAAEIEIFDYWPDRVPSPPIPPRG